MFIKVEDKFYEVKQGSKKSYYNKNTNSGNKEILVTFHKALKPSPDTKAYKRAKREQDKVKNGFNSEMKALLQKFIDKDITKNQFKNSARKIFKSSYEKSFEAGAKSTGIDLDITPLPDADYKWLLKTRKAEYEFFNNFLNDISDGKGTMDYFDRMAMYGEVLDSVFDSGRVDAMPSAGTKINWTLRPGENCPDCLELASRNPYTPEDLPTTPKQGDTRCLTNCNCYLKITYEAPKYVDLQFKSIDKVTVTGKEWVDWDRLDANVCEIFNEDCLRNPKDFDVRGSLFYTRWHKYDNNNEFLISPYWNKARNKDKELRIKWNKIFHSFKKTLEEETLLIHRLGDYIKTLTRKEVEKEYASSF